LPPPTQVARSFSGRDSCRTSKCFGSAGCNFLAAEFSGSMIGLDCVAPAQFFAPVFETGRRALLLLAMVRRSWSLLLRRLLSHSRSSLAVHPRQVFTAVRIGQVFTALGRSLPPCKLGLVFTTLDWFSPSTRQAGLHRPRQVFTAVRIGQVFTALGRSLPPCNRSATAGFHWLCTRILLYPCHYTCRLSHHCL
jgi:hypothetical protein